MTQAYLFDEYKDGEYEIINSQKIYKDFDYYDDNAEAVVYLIFQKGLTDCNNVYVMKREEAVRFCSRKETAGNNWAFAFTTYSRDWRESIDKDFRKDDGRFDWLLKELGIEPIYRKK